MDGQSFCLYIGREKMVIYKLKNKDKVEFKFTPTC